METIKLMKRLLTEVNSDKVSGNIITRKLSDNVLLARIWLSPLTPKELTRPLNAYFLKEQEKYVGMVLEQESGPFAFIFPSSRKNGFMSAALRQVILPHLLQQKPILRLHLSAAELGGERVLNTAKKLALAAGFELLKEESGSLRFTMDASRLKDRTYIRGENERLPKERLAVLKSQIEYAASVLSVVQTELEYKRGITGYSEELGDYIKALFIHADKLEHAWLKS